jgi:hypothetical protein
LSFQDGIGRYADGFDVAPEGGLRCTTTSMFPKR